MTDTVRYEAVAQRSGTWWAVSVPQLPGVFTQSRRLTGKNGATEMAREAIALFTGSPRDAVSVNVRPILPPHLDDEGQAVRAARDKARAAAEAASSQVEAYIRRLLEAGVTVRDAGILLDLSPQRISQLAPRGDQGSRLTN